MDHVRYDHCYIAAAAAAAAVCQTSSQEQRFSNSSIAHSHHQSEYQAAAKLRLSKEDTCIRAYERAARMSTKSALFLFQGL